MLRILMVEDEKYIAEAMEQVLKKNHYTVDLAFDGEYGLSCALSGIYDMIILDIMPPQKDGIRGLKEARQSGAKTPILLLTARSQIEDKVLGLDSGADDYLAKPFHADELLARLRALGRRNSELIDGGVLKFGDIELNPNTLSLICKGRAMKLALKEAQLLELLIKRKNTAVSKEIMIEKLWGYDTDAEDSLVETHISLLRKELAQLGSGVSVRTIRGAGYILTAEKDGVRHV